MENTIVAEVAIISDDENDIDGPDQNNYDLISFGHYWWDFHATPVQHKILKMIQTVHYQHQKTFTWTVVQHQTPLRWY